ncbi:MAG TPA: hypothetical protein VJJ48_00150 [Candidatus Paceibacterota bacterium]
MKISINSKFLEGPYGGGMQFANFMKDFLTSHGVEVTNKLENNVDIILHVNPFPHLTPDASSYSYLDAYEYKLKNPKTIIIERVNECDERKGTTYMNKLLVEASNHSDFVVFIANWLRPLLLKEGLPEDKPYKVILNGGDHKIFNTQDKEFWDGKNPIKIVTHHWSDNPNKGSDVYQALDELLSDSKFGELFEFTYIGRTNVSFKNSRVIAPLSGQELVRELKQHHVYITASRNEPGGMHHIEGALCGLPILYINSGALPEYCGGYGLEFNKDNLRERMLEIRERYQEFKDKIITYPNTAEKMGLEYLNLCQELLNTR